MHMPGHKGKSLLGYEKNDITEIFGADSLYQASGIIKESEQNGYKGLPAFLRYMDRMEDAEDGLPAAATAASLPRSPKPSSVVVRK